MTKSREQIEADLKELDDVWPDASDQFTIDKMVKALALNEARHMEWLLTEYGCKYCSAKFTGSGGYLKIMKDNYEAGKLEYEFVCQSCAYEDCCDTGRL